MTYKDFLAAIGDGCTAAIHVRGAAGNVTEFYDAAAFDPMTAQRRLQLLSDWACVVVDMPCTCEYVVSAEHMGIQRACRLHVVRHVTGL